MTHRRQFLSTLTGALLQSPFLRGAETGSSDNGTLLWRHFMTLLDAADSERRARFAKLQESDLPDLRTRVRRTLMTAFGAFPPRNPLNARQVGTLTRPDYVIEKIIFESRPEYYVTANLYRPRSTAGRRPGIIQSCGHYAEAKAWGDYQRACITLAKAGLVVLVYDPIGQGERVTYGDGRGSAEHTAYGDLCWLVGRTLAHFRAWDAIRALDYLETRPEVDKSRLGMFGHSGGGMMTLLTAPVEDRLQAVMSCCATTSFYHKTKAFLGGDAEQIVTGVLANGIDHPELIAAVAPRYFLIGSARKDYVPIEGARRTYAEVKPLLGDRVGMAETDDVHKMNRDLREACCRWMLKHLAGETSNVRETDFPIETEADLRCTTTGCVMDLTGAQSIFDINRAYARELAGTRKGAADLPRLLALQAKEPAIALTSKLTPGRTADPLLVIVAPKRQPALLRELTAFGYPILELDLRGWGETTPKVPGAKQNYPWDEFFAGRGFELGRPLLGMRVRDLLGAIPRDKKVYVIGVEDGGVVALHAAAIDKAIAGVATVHSLGSYHQLFEQIGHKEPVSSFAPGALHHYDLPQLVSMIHPRPCVPGSGVHDILKGLGLTTDALP